MTVADNYNIEKQATNGTTKTFSFNFYTFSKDFVKVIKETDGVQSVVPSNQYTIKLNTVGGNVIFGVAPASGSYIIIIRETPREQETSFSTSSGFPAKTVEGRFDKLTSMIQEMQDTGNRTPSFPVGTELNVTLPLPEAGKAIIWNNTEDGLENSQSTFDDIITTAVAAKDAAEFAQGKAEDAQTAAETAQRLAESAKDDAVAAKTDAETAVAGFDDYVDSRKSEIDAYVETASDAASAASTSATNAHNSELAAASSESNASDYKDLAYTYSQNAYQSANDAQTEADNIRSALDGYATKAELPVVTDKTITINKNSTTVGSFTTNSATDVVITIPVPVRASDVDALSTDTKYGAAVSLSVNPSTFVLTAQLKDQNGSNLGAASTVDLPLESVVVNGTYDDDNKEIVLTLQSGATIEIPVADLVAGLQSEITSDNMLDADLVDDSTSANKFVTESDKTTWNGKQDTIADLDTIRSGASAGATAVQPSALSDYVKSVNGNNPDENGNVSLSIFAKSTTAASTVEKVVSIPSIKSLAVGTTIIVQPTVTSTVANSTIKLNNFPAYTMRYNNANITTSTDSIVWNSAYLSIFTFDGTNWQFVAHGIDNNTTYSAMSVSEGTTGTATSSRAMRADYLKQIILGTKLAGLNTSTAGAVVATDSVLSAMGKIQATIGDVETLINAL